MEAEKRTRRRKAKSSQQRRKKQELRARIRKIVDVFWGNAQQWLVLSTVLGTRIGRLPNG